MSRLVVASNRLDLPPGNLAPGGVSVSLAATLQHTGGLWFGWSGQVRDDAGAVRCQAGGAVDYAAVDLTPDEYAGFYNGYSNGVLWPLCHGLPALAGPQDAWRRCYEQVNHRYARGLAALLRADDTLWVHDYHLLPLGAALRKCGVTQPIGHFLHVPFPPLPSLHEGAWLLEALLAYDLVGFQTGDDLAAFHRAASWRWGAAAVAADGSVTVGARTVAAGVFPVGVAVDGIQAAATRQRAQATAWWPGEGTGGRIIGADRLDASKGLASRLDAYAGFLALHEAPAPLPHYLQFITPSRGDLPDRQQLRSDLDQAAARINLQHGSAVADPLRCVHRALPHEALMGVLATADVGLVTPLRDGMNLLAKEFVAAQPAAAPGVLVLSRHAGAARELEAALLVDPHDVADMARAIASALSMPLGERRERHQVLLAALRRRDLGHWHATFLQRLHAVAAARRAFSPPAPVLARR